MQKQGKQDQNQGRHTAAYIRGQKDELMQSVRGPQPDSALDSFYKDMAALCSRPESCIDHMHLNAIIGATAKAWRTSWAQSAGQKQKQAHHQMHAFLTEMFQRLQPLLPDVEARQAANILWSSAQLGLNPDALVPGMTDSWARQFMVDMDVATGQGFANVLVACAKLQLSPCQGQLFKAILNRLAIADLSNFEPQHVSNTLHSLATIPAAAPSVEVLDALCQRFDILLKRHQTAEFPNAQSIANTMWALSKLKYAPSDELAMSMVGRMVALCGLPGHHPKPQEISNCLLACAELRLLVNQAITDSLASFLLSSNGWQATPQAYANTAWSLAVTGHLRSAQFTSLLDQMLALSGTPGDMSTTPFLTTIELGQLYQALDWLQPAPTSPAQQQAAWSSLEGKLQRLGPRPAPPKPPVHGNRKLCAALDQLQLPFKATVFTQSYWLDAVLQPQDNKSQPVMLRLFSPDYITNIPGRSCSTLTDWSSLLNVVFASCCICISLSANYKLFVPALAFACNLTKAPKAACHSQVLTVGQVLVDEGHQKWHVIPGRYCVGPLSYS